MSSTGNRDQKQLRRSVSQVTKRIRDWPLVTQLAGTDLIPVDGPDNTKVISHLNHELQVGGSRMRWKGIWSAGEYVLNDVVLDSGWTMIANQTTSERAAPQPIGSPWWASGLGTAPAWTPGSVSSDQLWTGARYTMPAAGFIRGMRLWIPNSDPAYRYRMITIVDPGGPNENTDISGEFNPGVVGWLDYEFPATIFATGTVFDVYLSATNTAGSTQFAWDWDYQTPQQDTIPASGEAMHSVRSPQSIWIHKTDDGGTDRSVDLATVNAGDTIGHPDGTSWEVTSVTDNGTWIDFGVIPLTLALPGVVTLTFTVIGAQPTDYVYITDHYLSNPDIQGIIAADSTNPILTQDAYGVDIQLQEADISAHWETVSTSAAVSALTAGSEGITGTGTPTKMPVFTGSKVIGDSNLTDTGTAVTSAVEIYVPTANIGNGTPKLWFWHPDYAVGPVGEPYRIEQFLHAPVALAHPSFVVRGPDRDNPATVRGAYIQFDDHFVGFPRLSSPGGGSPPTWNPGANEVFSGLTAIAYDPTDNVFWAWSGAGWDVVGPGGGGGGAVDSVFGRTGVVVAVSGDYTALLVDFSPATSQLTATDVQNAIDELAGEVSLNSTDRHSHINLGALDKVKDTGLGDEYLADDGNYKPITPNPYAEYATHNYDSGPIFTFGPVTPSTWYKLVTSPLIVDDVAGFTSMSTFGARYDGSSRRFKIELGITLVNPDVADLTLDMAIYVNSVAARSWTTTITPSGKEHRRWGLMQMLTTNDLVEVWFRTPQTDIKLHNCELMIS